MQHDNADAHRRAHRLRLQFLYLPPIARQICTVISEPDH